MFLFFVKTRNAYSINSSKLEAKSINHYEEGISEGFLNTLRYNESSFQVSDSAKNQILNEIEENIPIVIADDKITISDHTELGENLNTYLI